MQGWPHFIPTKDKIAYLNELLRVGFDTLDFGSFVSPKAIPQLADTAEVLAGLDLSNTKTKLLAIIANQRGAIDAVSHEQVSYLGFPFSISETFQKRNTNSSIQQSLETVEEIQNLCVKTGKQLVVYISMGFGNPYGDPFSESVVFDWVHKLAAFDIKIISLADTVGLAEPAQVSSTTKYLVDALPDISIGVHLHSLSSNWRAKLDAAVDAGCLRFDGALKGIGGCPMAGNDLVGNMDTQLMIPYFRDRKLLHNVNEEALQASLALATRIFA